MYGKRKEKEEEEKKTSWRKNLSTVECSGVIMS